MAADTESPPERKPFAAFIQEQGNGSLHATLSEALAEVVTGVTEHGKAGELTLKLKVKDAGDGQVFVTPDVKAKVPAAEQAASMFFVDGHGNLTRQHPNQGQFDGLREAGERKAS